MWPCPTSMLISVCSPRINECENSQFRLRPYITKGSTINSSLGQTWIVLNYDIQTGTPTEDYDV